MSCMKHLVFVIFFLFTQNVNANWVTFFDGPIFNAKLLLESVQQDNQKTQALIALKFKDKLFSDGVGSHVIFLEHICGEISPTIIEQKFYEGNVNESKLLTIESDSVKFKQFLKLRSCSIHI